MALTAGQRITIINKIATLLDKRGWSEIDLILGQHGLPTNDLWVGSEARTYVIDMVKDSSDSNLSALHSYLTSESDSVTLGRSPYSGEKVRVFMSHLALHRELVGLAGQRLANFKVEAFVAHDSIEPSREWQQVIEAGLSDCDAMVVFLHAGFKESNWCDQEVGWVMGRNRPLLPLNFDLHPHGFMGKFQSLPCHGQNGWQVGNSIMNWLVTVPTLHSRLAESLSQAFSDSGSWDFTRALIPLLEQIPSFTEDQLSRIENAARVNVNVREVNIGGITGPQWMERFTTGRRGGAI